MIVMLLFITMSTGRILVVEDESKIADIVKAYLEKDNFSVTVAGTGQNDCQK